jgi:hypothetical protein
MQVAEGWGKLNTEGFRNLNVVPNITKVIESRTLRILGHARYLREVRRLRYFDG